MPGPKSGPVCDSAIPSSGPGTQEHTFTVSSGPNQGPPSLRADSGGEGHSGEVEGIAAATGLLVGVVVRVSNSKSSAGNSIIPLGRSLTPKREPVVEHGGWDMWGA